VSNAGIVPIFSTTIANVGICRLPIASASKIPRPSGAFAGPQFFFIGADGIQMYS
jgi:hypothetical protein